MDQTVANLLKNCEHPSEVEVEARIKKQLITTDSIHALLHCGMQWEQSTYTERKKISKTHRKCTYRQRVYNNAQKSPYSDTSVISHTSLSTRTPWCNLQKAGTRTKMQVCPSESCVRSVPANSIICKSSIAKEDFNDMWCTVHISIETPVPSMIQAISHADPIKVRRHRTLIESHYVDIIENMNELPRVEIEVCDPKEFKLENMMVVVRRVCDIMNGEYPTRTPYVRVSFYDWKMLMHVASKQYGPFCIEKMLFQKPETMTIDILSNISKYMDCCAVTPKVDGIRKFIIVANDRVYSLGIMKDVKHLGLIHSNYSLLSKPAYLESGEYTLCMSECPSEIILDCEYVKTTDSYYVFDIAVHDGKYYGNASFKERQQKVEELVSDLSTQTKIYAKPYKEFDSFDSLKSLYEEFSLHTQGVRVYDMDGLIFVDRRQEYIDPVYKWKSHNTIDLELLADTRNRDIYAYTCDGKSVDIQIENPLFVLNSNTVANIAELDGREETYNENTGNSERVVKAGVWELSYDDESKKLSVMRYRPDKPQGNNWSIVQKNLYSSVPGTIFSGRGFYLMRKYHNKVKKQMIITAKDKKAKILDVGTGQGGDLNKWKRASHVFCVEPSKEATEEMLLRMQQRDTTYPSTIKVINVPLRDLDISQISEKIDIFTLFFCMNQWLDTDWSKLKDVINEKGSKNCRLLAIAMTEPEEYNSECFTIKKYADKYNISIHGTRILNIDETPVNPIKFKKMMETSCGMTKVTEKSLDEDSFMTRDERKLSSMYTMFVYRKG